MNQLSKIKKTLVVAALGSGLLAGFASPASAASASYGSCVYGSGSFSSVDNSGLDRSFTMRHSLSKYCGVHAKTQYKMNFGAGTSTGWNDGLERYSNGSESGYVTDHFHIGNTAVGAWFRVCGASGCGSSDYIDNPYN
jgi:hypothetical protein